MCSPTAAVMVTAVAVSAYSAHSQQSAANQAADYNAKIADRNAEISDAQANDATTRGQQAEDAHRRQLSRFKGEQRTAYGASGVLVDEGSSMDVLTDTAEQGELDALTIRRNAAMESWTFKETGKNYRSRASLLRAGKRSAGSAAFMSVLTGGTGMAAQYGMSGGFSKK